MKIEKKILVENFSGKSNLKIKFCTLFTRGGAGSKLPQILQIKISQVGRVWSQLTEQTMLNFLSWLKRMLEKSIFQSKVLYTRYTKSLTLFQSKISKSFCVRVKNLGASFNQFSDPRWRINFAAVYRFCKSRKFTVFLRNVPGFAHGSQDQLSAFAAVIL